MYIFVYNAMIVLAICGCWNVLTNDINVNIIELLICVYFYRNSDRQEEAFSQLRAPLGRGRHRPLRKYNTCPRAHGLFQK